MLPVDVGLFRRRAEAFGRAAAFARADAFGRNSRVERSGVEVV